MVEKWSGIILYTRFSGSESLGSRSLGSSSPTLRFLNVAGFVNNEIVIQCVLMQLALVCYPPIVHQRRLETTTFVGYKCTGEGRYRFGICQSDHILKGGQRQLLDSPGTYDCH